MKLSPNTPKVNGKPISMNNPFKDDIERFQRSIKSGIRTHQSSGEYKRTRITIIEQTQYFPGSFAKLYRNKELMDDLSPEACKILMHIALHINYDDEVIQLKYSEVGMERRKVAKGILELLGKRIISKQKKEWYWVNITLLIVGNIDKED